MDTAKLARAHHSAFLVCAMIMPCRTAVCMASELSSWYILAWHWEDGLDVFSCEVNDCFQDQPSAAGTVSQRAPCHITARPGCYL